jgi:signal transduction histidine kinase
MIEDILDLSRFEFNKFELHYSNFKVKDVIDEVMQMIKHQAKFRNIELGS